MTAAVTPIESAFFLMLRVFVLNLIQCEVVRGRRNLTPNLTEGIVLSPLFNKRLSTNSHQYVDPVTEIGEAKAQHFIEKSVQIDCYGPNASSWATILSTLLRDEYGCEFFTDVNNVEKSDWVDETNADLWGKAQQLSGFFQPLDADEPQSIEFVDPGEKKYVERWMVVARFQYNAEVTTPITFFDTPPDKTLVAADLL